MGKKPRDMAYSDYGLTKERIRFLKSCCRAGTHETLINDCIQNACSFIAPQMRLSVKFGIAYDRLEYTKKYGRIPCGRTDFYGYQRLFYHLLDINMNRVQREPEEMVKSEGIGA